MKDRILSSYLNDFIADNNLAELKDADVFEHLVNYCIISREHPENFDYEKVSVGGTHDLGIDGVAIIVNEHLVSSKQEIDFFKTNLRRLDVKFFFIQSKTSDKFSASEIGNFIFGVKRFFSADVPEKINSDLKHLMKLKEYIYDYSIDMDKPPECHLFYVTTGKWVGDAHLIDRIDKDLIELGKSDLFSDVKLSPIDIDAIKQIYKELKLKITKEINFERHTILPPATGISEAYIGIIPCKEYLKLITDTEGNLLRKLFYDNVRDFQGNNPVNMEINESLNNQSMNDKFALFNNGITIVAQSINKIGTSFKIKDYQIVNGCQTSHILFRNRSSLSDNSLIPLKLIVTDDGDITNSIIKATNRQSEVKIEAFESLSPFQKKIEEFYLACSKDSNIKIYYERRSKQYDHLPISKNQIISLSAQVICFVAMFLNEPHSTHRYYGELLEAYRGKIFIDNHSPYPYFLSGLSLHLLEKLFKSHALDPHYRKYKYHLMMLIRLQSETKKMPYLNNNKKIDNYCQHIQGILVDKDKAVSAYQKCIDTLKYVLDTNVFDKRECLRLRAFTSAIIKRSEEECNCTIDSTAAEVEREQGVVIKFSDIRGYGFIRNKNDEDVFIHYTNIIGKGYKSLSEGQKVEYTVVDTDRGLSAENLVIL